MAIKVADPYAREPDTAEAMASDDRARAEHRASPRELLALRWDVVDLVAGRLVVNRNVWRGREGPPKGGRSRDIPLNALALDALKATRSGRS